MASIKELQSAIDTRNIDTRKLSQEQLQALDTAFKTGELTGYEGVEDYQSLMDLGAASVAGQKEKRLKPCETATGVDRGDLVFAGAASGSMIPYFMNRDQIMDAFVQSNFKDRYGVDTRFANMADMYQKRMSVLGKAAEKLGTDKAEVGVSAYSIRD